MKKVLVICTGNSCRSIMAEALFNDLGKGNYHAVSAGSTPEGYVNPQALKTLARHNIDIENPTSQSWDEFKGQAFDLVVTVCDNAARETCPTFSGPCNKIHWSIADPFKAKGSDEEITAVFDDTYLMLKERIEQVIAQS